MTYIRVTFERELVCTDEKKIEASIESNVENDVSVSFDKYIGTQKFDSFKAFEEQFNAFQKVSGTIFTTFLC